MKWLHQLDVILHSGHSGIWRIHTHMTWRERLLLFNLARSLPRESILVEIGSYLGASSAFLAAGIRGSRSRVYCVDTWTNIGMSEGTRDTYEQFLENTEPLRQWIVPLRGLSTEVAKNFNDVIDLLFVDGDHSYEAVRADLETWLQKVKDGGIVIFHDYNWAEGVRQAVREMVVPFQDIGARRLDSIYWTRIGWKRSRKPTVSASLIVPTYGRPEYLRDALVSLLRQDLPSARYEIIVVDNKPTGEAIGIVHGLEQEYRRSIRYVEERKVGLHNARHAGARVAGGEILVYVDDDVVVHPKWLSAILDPFSDPQVGIAGGRVVPRWEARVPSWISKFPATYLSLLDLGEEMRELEWPEGVHGCNMAVRRSALYEVGGFNPDGMGNRRFKWLRGDGETGLHRKVYDAGYKVVYEPKACLYHRIPASRLTLDYFSQRAAIHGISDSYSHIRQYPSKRRMLRHAVYCLLKVAHSYIQLVRYPHRAQQTRGTIRYWYARGEHQIRVMLSGNLRRYVLQDAYL